MVVRTSVRADRGIRRRRVLRVRYLVGGSGAVLVDPAPVTGDLTAGAGAGGTLGVGSGPPVPDTAGRAAGAGPGGGFGVTLLEGAEAEPAPRAFFAVTVKV